MRAVLHGDLVALARVLLAAPAQARAGLCRSVIAEARVAAAVVRRLRRPHPRWGDGSVMAACAAHPARREPFASDAEYLDCLGLVIATLARRARVHLSGRGRRRRGRTGGERRGKSGGRCALGVSLPCHVV